VKLPSLSLIPPSSRIAFFAYRILAAEDGIAKRVKELDEEPGDHNDEREVLNDAAYAMRALRSTLKVPSATIASEGRTAVNRLRAD
jgi:hypothetical protein